MLDAQNIEIGGTSPGRQAIISAPEGAMDPAPADENTGATASEQAMDPTPEGANLGAPAENPGNAGRDAAIFVAPERANADPPHHDEPVVIDDGGEAVQVGHDREVHSIRDRFADPLIAEITELWRLRQAMVEGQRKLTLQAKSICRRFTQGDKTEAEKLWNAVAKGREHPLAERAEPALLPFLQAQEPIVAQRKAFEKTLAKLGKQLPIAHVAENIKGVSSMTLATIVGELGDLSAYDKGIAGIWKRAGLAVIDGERQRLKAGDAALIHAYSPSRRSVFWNIGGALIKAQGTDGPYREVYDQRKVYELAREIPKAHAHNRAMRHMTKRLLKDLWRAWP